MIMQTKGRPSKNGVMTFEAMLSDQDETRKTRLYKSDKAESLAAVRDSISQSVKNVMAELQNMASGEKIRLADTDALVHVTQLYLLACSKKGTIPTINGLARALGHTRQSLDWYIRNKSDRSADWLISFRDVCSDILSQNALAGSVHPVFAIFIQKAMYGLKDTITLESVPVDNYRYSDEPSVDEIYEKYKMLVDDDQDGSVDWNGYDPNRRR